MISTICCGATNNFIPVVVFFSLQTENGLVNIFLIEISTNMGAFIFLIQTLSARVYMAGGVFNEAETT